MTITPTESAATKNIRPEVTGTTRSKHSRPQAGAPGNGRVRYFLGTEQNHGGAPALGREVSSEGEALVEALRLGVTYYTLEEFRVVPDCSGKLPLLNKEPVAAGS